MKKKKTPEVKPLTEERRAELAKYIDDRLATLDTRVKVFCEKLEALLEKAYTPFELSLDLLYATTTPEGNYHDCRDPLPGTEEEQNTYTAWADGLWHKYIDYKVHTDEQLKEMDQLINKDTAMMKRLLSTVAPVKKLTVAEMCEFGYGSRYKKEKHQ